MTTSFTVDNQVAVVRIDEPRGNSLSFETITSLTNVLGDVEKNGTARAVMLTGRGRVFSAGLDLRACARYDRAQLAKFVDAFEGLFERIFSFPLPIVAYLNGHAIAGGAVIALACDVRVIAVGADFALNEVELGIPFPSMAFEIARYAVPSTSHVDAIQLGKRFDAADANERGIVDDVGTEQVALDRAREFVGRGHAAVVATKRALRADTVARARARATESRAAFVDAFLADDAQQRIGALVAKLEAR